jgi:hypothetical protein
MLAYIGLELVAGFQLVEDKFSAVCASLFIAVGGAECATCVAVGDWGSNLFRRLAVARDECIHALKLCPLPVYWLPTSTRAVPYVALGGG